MKLVPNTDLFDNAKRRSRFAEEITADAFGPRYWGWRQWADFRDHAPGQPPSRRLKYGKRRITRWAKAA